MKIFVISLILHVHRTRLLKASTDLLKLEPNLPNVMLNMVDALSSLFLFEKKLSAEAVVHKFGVLKDFKKIIGKGRLRSLF